MADGRSGPFCVDWFGSVVSCLKRCVTLSGRGPLRAGPRVASRFLLSDRQPVGPPETCHPWPGSGFRPLPCGRILASSLRSALWIARGGPPPLRFCNQRCLSEKNNDLRIWKLGAKKVMEYVPTQVFHIATKKDNQGQPLRWLAGIPQR